MCQNYDCISFISIVVRSFNKFKKITVSQDSAGSLSHKPCLSRLKHLFSSITVVTVFVGTSSFGLFSFSNFVHFSDQVLGRIEHPVGLLPACEASLTLLVVGYGALLAEVMLALGDHRVDKGLFADEALEGQILVVGTDDVFVVVFVVQPVGSVLHLALQLPAKLVVGPVVHEFTTVSETTKTGLFVVLTNVGRVIPTDR